MSTPGKIAGICKKRGINPSIFHKKLGEQFPKEETENCDPAYDLQKEETENCDPAYDLQKEEKYISEKDPQEQRFPDKRRLNGTRMVFGPQPSVLTASQQKKLFL